MTHCANLSQYESFQQIYQRAGCLRDEFFNKLGFIGIAIKPRPKTSRPLSNMPRSAGNSMRLARVPQESRGNILKENLSRSLTRTFRMSNLNCFRLRSKLSGTVLLAVSFLASCGNRANPAPKPQPQPPPPFEYLSSWGEKSDGPGKLNGPVSFAADSLGDIFFPDPASGFVHKFESNGT
ncbi:MAG TPA: hypothetical protein VH161_08185, partial [Candidatus Acidoferrales bacterium]|nr:hypothetical protein [Candidatus Acidoferrales bacterium]